MDFNILGGAAQFNPQAFSAAFNQAQQLQMQQQQQQQQQQQLQLRMDLATRAAQGDTEAFAQLNALDPANQKAWENTWNTASTAQQNEAKKFVSSLIGTAGNVEQQDSILDSRIAALENAGNDPEQLQVLKAIRQTPPDARAPIVESMGFRVFGAEELGKLREMQRKEAAFPVEQRQAQAAALKTELENAAYPLRQQAEIMNLRSQVADRAGRLALDRDRFGLDFEKSLIDQIKSNQVKLSAGMETLQAKAVADATTAVGMGDKAEKMAKDFRAMGLSGGQPARFVSALKRAWGADDAVETLKEQATSLVNSAAIQQLPPGPATDKDIELVRQGFPDPQIADGARMAEWLDAFARTQKAVAKIEEARADWIGAVGNLGRAGADIVVAGKKVPAGMTFAEFTRQTGTKQSNQPSYLRYGQ